MVSTLVVCLLYLSYNGMIWVLALYKDKNAFVSCSVFKNKPDITGLDWIKVLDMLYGDLFICYEYENKVDIIQT